MWFHIQKRTERNKDGAEEEASFVSVLLKTSFKRHQQKQAPPGLQSGRDSEAHLNFSVCSHFPVPLCIPALWPFLLDGDSLSSKEPIKSRVTLADNP